MVLFDNRTKWNIWHQMLDVVIQLFIINTIDNFNKEHFDIF